MTQDTNKETQTMATFCRINGLAYLIIADHGDTLTVQRCHKLSTKVGEFPAIIVKREEIREF